MGGSSDSFQKAELEEKTCTPPPAGSPCCFLWSKCLQRKPAQAGPVPSSSCVPDHQLQRIRYQRQRKHSHKIINLHLTDLHSTNLFISDSICDFWNINLLDSQLFYNELCGSYIICIGTTDVEILESMGMSHHWPPGKLGGSGISSVNTKPQLLSQRE